MTERDKIFIISVITALLIGVGSSFINVQSAPQEFISAPATTTPQTDFGFTIGTTSNLTAFGSSTLSVYGSTTIQTRINTLHAFEVFNAASSSIFRISTKGTTTSSVGVDISDGCFAIDGACLASGVSGSGTLNEVTFWSSGTALTSDPQMTFDPGNNLFTITDLLTTRATSTNATTTTLRVSGVANVQELITANITSGGILFSGGSGLVTGSGVLTNGQLLIGDGSDAPTAAGLTGTADQITITNGAGSITISIPTPAIISQLTVTSGTTTNATSTFLAVTSAFSAPAGFGGRSLTVSGTALDADNELYNDIDSISIASSSLSANLTIAQHKFATAVTITRISCSTDAGTADIQFDERVESTPNTAGTDVMGSPALALQCDNDGAATTTFNNAGIAADAPLNLDIDAAASSPKKLRIFIEFTRDD